MDKVTRITRIRRMLCQVAPREKLEAISEQTTRPELEGPPIPALAHVKPAVDKILKAREAELNPLELNSLEAIIMPRFRPVVFIRNGVYDDVGVPWTHLNGLDVRTRIAPLLTSIGRVELPVAPWPHFGGTAFVVGNALLMTNRHVARLFADGLGMKGLRYRAGDAAIDFKREVDTPEDDTSALLHVVAVEMIHPFWDMAILRVEGLEGRFSPLPLSIRSLEDLEGSDVVAVGYPARDDRSDLALQDEIFCRRYNVKRLQPGKLCTRERITSFENVVNAITHDSSTLGGNSGSAVIDVASAEVVGLHFAGVYLKANYAVPTCELARDSRVVKLGLRFGGSLPAAKDWEPAWRSADPEDGALDRAPAPSGGPSPVPSTPAEPPGATTAVAAATWTVPIQLSFSAALPGLGQAPRSPAPAAGPALEFPMRVPVIYDGLENRIGYQPGFLELDADEVPMPELTALGRKVAARLEDGSAELKYHRFSIVMHRGRRIALLAASNVDWREASRCVGGRKPSRRELSGLPDKTLELWVTDWRIPLEHQLPDVFYTKDGGAFDKGHLVRRDDVCWGDSFKEIQKGNGDTYHTTNCSPQVKAFNQSAQGEDNWGDLENMVQAQTQAEKCIAFAGPVFEDDDPLFEGRDDRGSRLLIRIPRRYWKMVVVRSAKGKGEVYGFVLEQDLSGVPVIEEFAVPKRWRARMKAVAEIEGMLNDRLAMPWLKRHDRFGSDEGVRISGLVQ